MKMDDALQAFMDDSSKLTFDNSEWYQYGGSLLEAAMKERQARERSLVPLHTQRRGSKVSNDIKLVFPFGTDEDKIDEAADGFDEAMQQINLLSSRCQRPGKANLRTHFLTILETDYDRLQPGEFLNDTLVDFWFQWYVMCITFDNLCVTYHCSLMHILSS
jgi:hypothetical protein